MKHIYVNFKRFDVPPEMGGVNRISDISTYGRSVVEKCLPYLRDDAEFAFFLPESQIIGAVDASSTSRLAIGSQSVYRIDTAVGGNFGAFTSNRPASAVAAMGCTYTIIGHCEERNDKNELLSLGGNSDRNAVDRILNREIRCALDRGLKVLYCIGEKSEEVEAWESVLTSQLEEGLRGIDYKDKVVIGYEPVWSIGPGKTPAGKDYITKVARLVKKVCPGIDVVYGGGLKEANAEMLSSIGEIDGGLIALTRFTGDIGFYPEEFGRIVDLYLEGNKN